MAGVQMNRTASGVVLPVSVSNEIWQGVQEQSVIARAARRIPLPGEGVAIPIITGDAVADWVAVETDEIKVSRPSLSNKTITGHRLGLIVPFSNEFRRDLPTLYAALASRLPNAIAKKFDQTVLGYEAAPNGNFATLNGIATVPLTGVASVTAAAEAVAAVEDASMTHSLLAPQADFIIGGLLDSEDRPLFPDTNTVFNKYGGTSVRSKHVFDATLGTVGVVGDFAGGAVWGQVEALEVSVSDQATITDGGNPINLWQRGMFALKVTAVMGFQVKDADAFVRYTSTAYSS